MSWTRNPYTATDFAVGESECGCATTHQATARLNASAAQYGGRIRHARRRANSPTLRSCQPDRAGAIASEKPDSTMNTTTAKCPYMSQPSHHGPVSLRVTGEGEQPAVVEDDEQGGDTADAVEPVEPRGRRAFTRPPASGALRRAVRRYRCPRRAVFFMLSSPPTPTHRVLAFRGGVCRDTAALEAVVPAQTRRIAASGVLRPEQCRRFLGVGRRKRFYGFGGDQISAAAIRSELSLLVDPDVVDLELSHERGIVSPTFHSRCQSLSTIMCRISCIGPFSI